MEALYSIGFQETQNYPIILPILSPETRAMKEALRGVGFQETHPMHWTSKASYLFPCRDNGYVGGIERSGVPGDTLHGPNHLNILPILSPETSMIMEALYSIGFQETQNYPIILPILSPETRAMQEALRGLGFQETHPMHWTSKASYLSPCRDNGYEGGVKRDGVPGDTPHAPNHRSILPILSPETRAMKEALRGVGFHETQPTSHLFRRFNFFTTCTMHIMVV